MKIGKRTFARNINQRTFSLLDVINNIRLLIGMIRFILHIVK